MVQAEGKGHARMILDAAWGPHVEGKRVFATAGRDKMVKVWVRKADGGKFELGRAVAEEGPVTALDFVPETTAEGLLLLAVGTEAGRVFVLALRVEEGGEVEVVSRLAVRPELCLPKAVTQLAWRPAREGQKGRELAIAGEDGSLRIYSFLSL